MKITRCFAGRLASLATVAVSVCAVTSCLQLQGETLLDVCPHSATQITNPTTKKTDITTFLTGGPAGRTLDKPWKNDYPLLIYSMNGVRAELDYEQAKQDADAKHAVADGKQKIIDSEQKDSDSTSDPTKKAALDADIKTRKTQQITLVSSAADADLTLATKEAARSSSPWNGKLFWVEAGSTTLYPLSNPSFIAQVYTTEKVLVLVCNAQFGDGSSMSETTVTVNNPDDTGTAQGKALTPVPLGQWIVYMFWTQAR
jgi:hypothetical protein